MKFKFPILAKIAILGTLTSVVAAGISIWVSYSKQVSRGEENLLSNIDNTLDGVDYYFKDDESAASNLYALKTVTDKAVEYYQDPDLKNAKLEDFQSFEEYEEFFKSRAVWFYPPPNSMIGSREYLGFAACLRQIQSYSVINMLSCDAVSCSVAKYDESIKGYIFAVDSRYKRIENGKFYHISASHYVLTPQDKFVQASEDTYDTFDLAGYHTKLTTIIDEDGSEVATFFIQYSLDNLIQENRKLLASDLIVLTSTSLAIIAIIVLASYLMFTRNIRKLTKASTNISAKLASNEAFSVEWVQINTHDEMKTLTDAFMAMQGQIINYTEIIKKEAAEKERTAAELSVASKIQLETLPLATFVDNKVALQAYIAPAKEVGGDFYDYFYLGDKLAVLISDVSGKGVPAALFMMRCKALIKFKLTSGLPLIQAIKESNDELVRNNDENLFVTSFVGIIDFENEEIEYVNAGHEKPYIIDGKIISRLDGVSNFVLGGMDGLDYVSEKVPFKKGDRLFMFTDGLNESINSKEEEFGYDRIVSSLDHSKGDTLQGVIANMKKDLASFVGEQEPFDDTTMMIIENKGDFHLHFEKKDYSIIEEAVNAFDEHFKPLSKEIKAKVGIIFDELLNNLVSYEKRPDLVIDVTGKIKGDDLILVISSNGADYDILANHKPKYATTHEDFELGGFGVAIVKDLTKDVSYEYKDGHSIVTMILSIDG